MEDKVFAPTNSETDHTITFQYWETVIRNTHFAPEKNLMLAVLEDAVKIYKKCGYSGNTRFKEAETWLFERDSDRLFSFKIVCGVLGLNYQTIPKGLLAWRLKATADLARTDKTRPLKSGSLLDAPDLQSRLWRNDVRASDISDPD